MSLKIVKIEADKTNVLRQTAKKFHRDEIKAFESIFKSMITITKNIGALGLSAPQINISLRVFVLNTGLICINPKIHKLGNKIVTSYNEMCLSLGDRKYNVRRRRKVKLSYFNLYFKKCEFIPKSKLMNFVVQHEMDHLNGILICDKGKKIKK